MTKAFTLEKVPSRARKRTRLRGALGVMKVVKPVVLIVGAIFPGVLAATEAQPPQAPGQSGIPPMTDIHDIKPLVAVGWDVPWKALLIVLIVLIALAAVYFIWRRWRKAVHAVDIVAELPPEVKANQSLDEISAVAQMDGKLFYYRLSAILRRYLCDRFGINAPEMTTEELLPQLEKLTLNEALFDGLARLCKGADPIKYAGERPMVSRMEADLNFARGFIAGTTPREIPEAPDPASPLPDPSAESSSELTRNNHV